MILSIITPTKTVFSGSVQSVTTPTSLGYITILPNHEQLVSVISPGELSFTLDEENNAGEQIFVVGQGVVEVSDNTITVLVNTTELTTDIDLDRAERAIEDAKRVMQAQVDVESVEYAQLQALIERNISRIRVKKKWADTRQIPNSNFQK